MNPLKSALIFPETEPGFQDIGKLLLFFNSLSYYLPTETDKDDTGRDLFKGLCNGYVPAPLVDDLDRFNSLLREMENSRSDELARLFSSAKSPIATGQIRDRDEASSGSLLSALQEDNSSSKEIEQKERLWQARLTLKLGELLDRRDMEISQGLERLRSDEQKIFANLQGADRDIPEQVSEFSNHFPGKGKTSHHIESPESSAPALTPIRVKAWAELFLADTDPDRPHTLVTTSPDAASILIDGYENSLGTTPVKLFTLSIPEVLVSGTDEEDVDKILSERERLRDDAADSLDYFTNFISGQILKQDKKELDQEYLSAWDEIIKKQFPITPDRYQKLDFYIFPGISVETLFQKTLHLEPVKGAKESGITACLLAVMHG